MMVPCIRILVAEIVRSGWILEFFQNWSHRDWPDVRKVSRITQWRRGKGGLAISWDREHCRQSRFGVGEGSGFLFWTLSLKCLLDVQAMVSSRQLRRVVLTPFSVSVRHWELIPYQHVVDLHTKLLFLKTMWGTLQDQSFHGVCQII